MNPDSPSDGPTPVETIPINVDLSRHEYATLLMMCGYATESAMCAGDRQLAASFIRLTNRLNGNNPNYAAYHVQVEP